MARSFLALLLIALATAAAAQCGSLSPEGARCGAACASKGGAVRNGAPPADAR